MKPIAEFAQAVARLEGLDAEGAARRDKEYRNLTQRLPLMPARREWRTDLFEFPTLAALRIVQIVSAMGVSRSFLGMIVNALQDMDRSTPPQPGMQPRVIDQMVERAKAGETFNVSIELRPGGEIAVRTHESAPVADAFFDSIGHPEPLASIVLPAGRLIRELHAELGDD